MLTTNNQQRTTKPPRFALRFFRWFCHPKLLKYIEGDLMELYEERLNKTGKRNADLNFVIDVILLFRPAIIRPAEGHQNLNTYGMYKSYLKMGWRNLAKNKVFSFINISGLSLGLTCSILIGLWVQDEYNMDAFHENLDRIYTITSTEYSGHEITYGGFDTPGLLGEEIKRVLPEIEYSCGYAWTGFNTFAVGDKMMKLPGNYAGNDFFKIFSYPLISGSRETALKAPESIAISRKMATNFFGSPEKALDQSMKFENYRELKVTAVFEDMGGNVSEKIEYLLNWDFFLERHKWAKDWHNSGQTTFIKLRGHANPEVLKPKLQHFIKNYDKEYTDLDRLELSMQPFGQKYLYSNFEDGKVAGGRIEYVRLFSWVATFILLIACINFMNLSTARSLKRAKEIGVRKVNGAIKTALISQFMMEAFLYTFIAVLFSLLLLVALLPSFNLLTGKNIVSPIASGQFWVAIAALTLITGIISGSYPALLLSSFKPIAILKQNLKMNSSSAFFRKGLVVFQFALSMIFIVGMIVISQQLTFIQNKNLGYQRNNLIYLPLTGSLGRDFDTFKNEARQLPGITEISNMSQRPVQLENTTGSVEWEGKQPDTRPIFTQVAVGYDFAKTMKVTLVSGRDFSEDFADSSNYIINEAALKIIGYKDAIGMPLTFWGVKGAIIGVVKDFHINSLHVAIDPLIMRLQTGRTWGVALIRTEPGKTAQALAGLEEVHKKLNPDFVFAHQFADEEYAFLYQSEQVVKQLSTYFAFLAIFISSLGLLGLVIFTAEQRTKEVGIRKVLGANISQLVALLSKDFMKLVGMAIVLAIPFAYYIMSEWLLGFEYHIDISWWVFATAAGGAVFVALATVSFQAIKAAMENPVKSLRSE
jgi:putative ABC transport system permease protein